MSTPAEGESSTPVRRRARRARAHAVRLADRRAWRAVPLRRSRAQALSAKLEPQNVIVHPIVLLNAVDHYNRVARDTKRRVIGILLGEISSCLLYTSPSPRD